MADLPVSRACKATFIEKTPAASAIRNPSGGLKVSGRKLMLVMGDHRAANRGFAVTAW
jgi:hypothetical protein